MTRFSVLAKYFRKKSQTGLKLSWWPHFTTILLVSGDIPLNVLRSLKFTFCPPKYLPIFISKVFEKVIFYRLCNYMNKSLNSLLCRFRKIASRQYALFKLLQVWVCWYYEPYCLDMASLFLLRNYLANRNQNTKVVSSNSVWFEFISGILQGFFFRPLLFKNPWFLTLQMTIRCILETKIYQLLLKTWLVMWRMFKLGSKLTLWK